jgi:hypothetical protein
MQVKFISMMRAILLQLCIVSAVSAQVHPGMVLRLKPQFITRFAVPANSDTVFVFQTPFNSAEISGPSRLHSPGSRTIVRVTLYYTTFHLSDRFSQPALNLERLEQLRRGLPQAFQSALVHWRLVAQDGARSLKEAQSMFHGFVVETRRLPDSASAARELDFVSEVALSDSLGRDTVYYTESWRVQKRRRFTGFYLPRSRAKRARNIVYRTRSIWKRNRQYVTVTDTIVSRKRLKRFIPSPYAAKFVYRHVPDTTVLAILNRNRHWRNMNFVVDVTGSMSPYSSQLFLWYKLNFAGGCARSFTFFNDGDLKTDRLKRVGKTGGILSAQAADPSLVVNTGLQCMNNGYGGDAPENNVEALLRAQERNPEAKELFMVADNWANMRDTSLMRFIRVPVHIILCGVSRGYVNTQYLDLARITKGSVHTMEQDLEQLINLSENSTIAIGEHEYIIRAGRFHRVTRT